MAFGHVIKARWIRVFLRVPSFRCKFSSLRLTNSSGGFQKSVLRSCLAKVESGSTSVFDAENAARLLQDPLERKHKKKFTIVIVALGRCGSWPKALDLFESMYPRAISPDAVTYGAIVGSCARNAQWAQALRLADGAVQSSAKRDALTSILRCVGSEPMRNQSHTASLNAAITACAKKGQWRWAMFVLFKMFARADLQPDIISYNASITACDRAAQWQRAFLILELAQSSHLELQTHTFNATIGAVARVGNWEMAFSVLQQIQRHSLVPNPISLNAVIGACGEASNWETTLRILNQTSVAMGVALDEKNFNFSMNACARSSQWQWALKLLGLMGDSKLTPNATSFATAISACEKSGRSGQALQLLWKMQQFRVAPDVIVFSSAISACEKASFWESALSVLNSIGIADGAIGVDIVLFNAAVSACEKGTAWSQALDLLDQIPVASVETNTITFGASVAACSKQGRWRDILYLLSEVEKRGVGFDAVILTCAARTFEETSAVRFAKVSLKIALHCALQHMAKPSRDNLRAHADCTGVIEIMHAHGQLTGTLLERVRHNFSTPALQSFTRLLSCENIDERTLRDNVRDKQLQAICDLGGICTRDALPRLSFDSVIGEATWLLSARSSLRNRIVHSLVRIIGVDKLSHQLSIPRDPVAARLFAWTSHDLCLVSQKCQCNSIGEVTQGGTREVVASSLDNTALRV